MGMHYKCIKAMEQKAYCLFIYLIGSNYASMYSENQQPKPIVICSDSCGHNTGVQMTHLPKLQMSQISRYNVTKASVAWCVYVCVCGLVLMRLSVKIKCLLVAVSECVRFARAAAAGVFSVQC